MPIIICPECKKEVSDTLGQCIHCGFQFKTSSYQMPDTKPKKKVSCLGAFVIIAGTIFIMGLLISQCDKSTPPAPLPDSAVMSSDPEGKALVQTMIDSGWVRFDQSIMVVWVSPSFWNRGDLKGKASLAHSLWLWQSSRLRDTGVIAIHDADNDKTIAYYSASHGLEMK